MYNIKKGILIKGDDVWLCLRCHMCEARCPNSVRIPDIIGELRELVLEERGERRVIELYIDLVRTVFDKGVAVLPASEEVERFKCENDLEVPPLPNDFKSELREFMRAIGFEDRIKRVMESG